MNRKFRNTFALFVALVALGLVIGFATGSDPENAPAAKTTPGSEEAQAQKLREQLQRPGLSDEGRKNLEEKLQIAERSATEQAAAGSAKRSVKNAPPPAAAAMLESESDFFEGIFEGSEGLVRPSQGDIANGWQGRYEGSVYQVFAGSSPDQPAKGLLIVAMLEEDRPTGQRQAYAAPGEVTRLRIIEVNAGMLLLETDAGERLTFDLSTRTFSK